DTSCSIDSSATVSVRRMFFSSSTMRMRICRQLHGNGGRNSIKKDRTSNVQHPTPNIQWVRAENAFFHLTGERFPHWMFDVGRWMLDVFSPPSPFDTPRCSA